MDVNVLIMMGITVGVVALAVLIGFLKKKGYVTEVDLFLVSQILGIGSDVLLELNPQDDKLVRLSEIIRSSIDSILKQCNEFGDIQKLIKEVNDMIYRLCDINKIEMTPNRIKIVNEMVNLLLPLAIKKIIIE